MLVPTETGIPGCFCGQRSSSARPEVISWFCSRTSDVEEIARFEFTDKRNSAPKERAVGAFSGAVDDHFLPADVKPNWCGPGSAPAQIHDLMVKAWDAAGRAGSRRKPATGVSGMRSGKLDPDLLCPRCLACSQRRWLLQDAMSISNRERAYLPGADCHWWKFRAIAHTSNSVGTAGFAEPFRLVAVLPPIDGRLFIRCITFSWR